MEIIDVIATSTYPPSPDPQFWTNTLRAPTPPVSTGANPTIYCPTDPSTGMLDPLSNDFSSFDFLGNSVTNSFVEAPSCIVPYNEFQNAAYEGCFEAFEASDTFRVTSNGSVDVSEEFFQGLERALNVGVQFSPVVTVPDSLPIRKLMI
jgi:hypothetical protein